MAIGDLAIAAGLPLVPDAGEEGRVRWGGREINRTRDQIAQTRSMLPCRAIATGAYSYVFNGGITLAHTITFPAGLFTVAPVPSLILYHNLLAPNVRVSTAPSKTSMGVTVYTDNASGIVGTIVVYWTAIQK